MLLPVLHRIFLNRKKWSKEKAVRDEEAYWRIKSRTPWLLDGDKNTKYFYAQTTKHIRCKKIEGLEDEHGLWYVAPRQVDSIAVRYFEGLFETCNPHKVGEITECVEARVSKTNNFDLMRPVTDEEIRSTLFQIPAIKSQGADGFSGSFYHDHWEVVGEDITKWLKPFGIQASFLRK